jgi:hypothetical protein
MLAKRVLGALSFAAVLAVAPVAFAQDDGTGGGDMGGGGDMSGSGDASGGMATTTTSTGGGDGSYKMGIETAFPTGGDGAHANFLWAMGKNWLDVSLGVDFSKTPDQAGPPAVEGKTAFGVDIGVGYRMVKPMKGKLSPYLEPAVTLGISDFANAGDTIALSVGATMGVTYEVIPQFTLGTGIGGGLLFADKFKTINFGLFTTSITAGFWW